jgi:hypothetical protein
VRDMIEMMEDTAEAMLDDMMQPDGRLRCSCGRLFRLEDGQPISPNPYAMPVCPTCFDEWVQTQKEKP